VGTPFKPIPSPAGRKREAPAWPLPAFWGRWLVGMFLGGERCAARHCGNRVAGSWRRFCVFHHDALVALHSSVGEERREAHYRIEHLPGPQARRLRKWADSFVHNGHGIPLVRDDHEPPAHPERRGIVVG
jgi:hypothetical protein